MQNPEESRDLLHLYLVKPAGGGQQAGEACRPKCRDKSEQNLLLQIASAQRNRIRQLAQWLADHPEAAAILKDTKGKGKGKASATDPEEIAQKQKAHFERCMEEIEPRQRLDELIASTSDWIECFKSRLEAIRLAQRAISTTQEHQSVSVDQAIGKERSKKRAARSTSAALQEAKQKRRRTIDRGTSPIQELQELAEKSVYLEQSREHDLQCAVSDGIDEPVQVGTTKSALVSSSALQEDDSPPSPQSLPSPPPPAQVRPKQSTTDDSQQSTNESSSKPIPLPSVRSMPPVQSSSSADDSFKITVIKDTTTTSVHDNLVDQTASTSRVKVVRKPKKRASRLPPPSSDVLSKLEEAAKEAEIKRKEEKARFGEFDYDPWEGLIGWVPPKSHEGSRPVLPDPDKKVIVEETVESSASTLEMLSAMSRTFSTFESFEAESSETASQGRREREENEARISEFLLSEEL